MKRLKTYVLLHCLIALYSMGGIFSKLASQQEFMSMGFCLCYAGVIGVLGIYAIGWQQIIKYMPLTAAFANKAVTVVWGLIFGAIFFQEDITPGKLLGIGFVVLGVVLFTGTDKETENAK